MAVRKRSAALLLYRLREPSGLEVLIAHMGGPFWAKKQARGWSIPKGEYEDDEEPLTAAMREFEEEMGAPPPPGEVVALGDCRQPSGKVITTYAIEGEFDLEGFHSNTFAMEWPKGSGTMREFPEVDRADWVAFDRACELLVKGQVPIITALRETLAAQGPPAEPAVRPGHQSGQDGPF